MSLSILSDKHSTKILCSESANGIFTRQRDERDCTIIFVSMCRSCFRWCGTPYTTGAPNMRTTVFRTSPHNGEDVLWQVKSLQIHRKFIATTYCRAVRAVMIRMRIWCWFLNQYIGSYTPRKRIQSQNTGVFWTLIKSNLKSWTNSEKKQDYSQ